LERLNRFLFLGLALVLLPWIAGAVAQFKVNEVTIKELISKTGQFEQVKAFRFTLRGDGSKECGRFTVAFLLYSSNQKRIHTLSGGVSFPIVA